MEFRLVDDDGKPVTETGKPGEIWIFGPNVMKGYYNKPEANAAAIDKGWFKSGDIATRDEDGFYFIVDRKKDMIIRGGFNVYPREVEEVLYAHEAIVEAAVIGVPHQSHGEEVKAVVALAPGARLSESELIAWSKERLAAYKYPRIVEFRDALPKGPTGGIQLLLIQSVDHLGKQGDVVTVKRGYALNYLLPQGLATVANEHHKRMVEKHRARLQEIEKARLASLRQVADAIAKQSITIEANANEEGHLYGSVTALFVGLYLVVVGLLAEAVTRLGAAPALPAAGLFVLFALLGLTLVLLSDEARQRLRAALA